MEAREVRFPIRLIPFVAAASVLVPAVARADFVVKYDFEGGSSVVLSPIVTGSDSASVNAHDFTAPGDASVSSSTDMGYVNISKTGIDLAAALADTDYFQFTIDAATPGQFLNLDSLAFDFGGSANQSHTANVVVQSSVGGFGTGNPTLTVTPNSHLVPGGTTNNPSLIHAIVDISSPAFDHLSAITFQFRFFDDSNDTANYDRIDNFVITGSPVPEPAAVSMLALGGLALLRRRR